MGTQTAWQKAGLTDEEWIAHVRRMAASRRELAQFASEAGNVDAAQQLTRSAIVRELYAAQQCGEMTRAETRVAAALLPSWAGSSSEELLATARDILAGAAVEA